MKTAFVTGATSGIGAACARAFVKEGWQVVATGRRLERLQELQRELGEDNLYPCAFDLSDDAAREAALASIPEKFRSIDCLVNNAGLSLGKGPVQDGDLNKWRVMIDTNIVAMLALTRHFLPTLIENKGILINISSAAANLPYANGNVYGASKAFVSRFSQGLRCDLHGTGVRVTVLEPGAVETEFYYVASEGDENAARKAYENTDPMTPEDMANAILWIANQPPRVNIERMLMVNTSMSYAGFRSK
jgi:serine 3-dehydrogenase